MILLKMRCERLGKESHLNLLNMMLAKQLHIRRLLCILHPTSSQVKISIMRLVQQLMGARPDLFHLLHIVQLQLETQYAYLLLAALNELELESIGIENAYLTLPCREKIWFQEGKEFRLDYNNPFKIAKTLCGLKRSGAAFRKYFEERLDSIGFKSSTTDPDVWTQPAAKPDGKNYCKQILCYINDTLGISYDPVSMLRSIDLPFKNDKVEDPEFYLGSKLETKNLNRKRVQILTSRDYANATVSNAENQLAVKIRNYLLK